MNALLLVAAVVVGTWNGNWFPSGRAEHRAHPAVEAAAVESAAKMLASGISRLDPEGTNAVILCLNEIRNATVASNLIAAVGRRDLAVAVVSGYRRRGNRLDYQQAVIATTLPVAEAGWSRWTNAKASTPPRGYAFAALVLNPSTTAAVYAVHLKSNYGGNTEEKRALNREKRTIAVEQLLEAEHPGRKGALRPVVIAGDLNADRWRREFAGERIFGALESAGFFNHLALLPPDGRGTHPSERWGASALDYVFTRGFDTALSPVIVSSDGLSDHDAVFAAVELPK
jgi:endonuclease/exonuclease/phosphatase family metal-dependent hydrolase